MATIGEIPTNDNLKASKGQSADAGGVTTLGGQLKGEATEGQQ